jgi:hypothetical protein
VPDVKPYSLNDKYWLMMILSSPLEISWTDAVDGELQTLQIEIKWEDELEQLFCTMTMLIIIKPVQT